MEGAELKDHDGSFHLRRQLPPTRPKKGGIFSYTTFFL